MTLQNYSLCVFTVWLLQISPAKHDGLSQLVHQDNPLSAEHNIWSSMCVSLRVCAFGLLAEDDQKGHQRRNTALTNKFKMKNACPTFPSCGQVSGLFFKKTFPFSYFTICASLTHHSWQFSFKFGFLLLFGYPNHVKTSPMLTVHLVSNYTPLPLLPPQRWIKDTKLWRQ